MAYNFFAPKPGRLGVLPTLLVGNCDATIAGTGTTSYNFGGHPARCYINRAVISALIVPVSASGTILGVLLRLRAGRARHPALHHRPGRAKFLAQRRSTGTRARPSERAAPSRRHRGHLTRLPTTRPAAAEAPILEMPCQLNCCLTAPCELSARYRAGERNLQFPEGMYPPPLIQAA